MLRHLKAVNLMSVFWPSNKYYGTLAEFVMISFPLFLLCIVILVDTYVGIAPIMCVIICIVNWQSKILILAQVCDSYAF